MKLKSKLLLLVLIPLLCLLLFAAYAALEKTRQAGDMRALAELAGVSAGIGSLVHEIQKERGMSAGFIGSKGANFATEVPNQRAEVDKRRADMEQQLRGFDAAAYGGRLRELLAEANQRLGELGAKRQAVSALGISGPEAIGYYTGTIGSLLAVVGQTASLSSDAGVTRLAAAYDGLLQAKEAAGIERATLSNVMGTDKFAPEMLVRFLAVSAAQETWLKVFQLYASAEQAAFYQSKVMGSAVDEVHKIKKEVVEKMHEPSLGMDAKHWFAKSTERINLLKEVESRLATDLTRAAESLRGEARRWMFAATALALFSIVLTLLAAFRLIRGILGQIGGEPAEAVRVAHAIAEGKLDNDIHLKTGDSVSLLASMKLMSDRLRGMIKGIEVGAAQVGQAARDLAQSSKSVAQASDAQSEAASATAAAVEQMTVGISQIADSAHEAHSISAHSEDLSRKGSAVVHGAADKMGKIADSVEASSAIIGTLEQRSKEISAVVGVIREIADQTNLLALNAAIEAARAGEQGRGFAVVADEVRKLAERTSASTSEIVATIAKIQGGTRDAVQSMVAGVEQVRSGTELAQQAGSSIVEIESEARRVVGVVNDITNSLKEQTAASHEIARNVENIATMVEANNAAAAKTATAAQQLEQLAEGLSRSIGYFRL